MADVLDAQFDDDGVEGVLAVVLERVRRGMGLPERSGRELAVALNVAGDALEFPQRRREAPRAVFDVRGARCESLGARRRLGRDATRRRAAERDEELVFVVVAGDLRRGRDADFSSRAPVAATPRGWRADRFRGRDRPSTGRGDAAGVPRGSSGSAGRGDAAGVPRGSSGSAGRGDAAGVPRGSSG